MSCGAGKRRGDRGSILVEAALATPVLAMILFGIIQYGYFISAYISVRNASAVGARWAAVQNANCPAAENDTTSPCATAARAALQPMFDPGLSTVTITRPVINGRTATTVTLTYHFPVAVSFMVPGASGGVKDIVASTTMH